MVDLIQDCLHETEDSTLYVPAALAKMAYAPVEAIRRKVRAILCVWGDCVCGQTRYRQRSGRCHSAAAATVCACVCLCWFCGSGVCVQLSVQSR